jgi:glycosyltransferase involved in cell wall biosynthesis
MLRILCLSPRQCRPSDSGAKLREYHLLKALGREAEVTHLSFAEPGRELSHADLPFCRAVISVERPRPYTPGKILRGFFGRWPLPVVNYTSESMNAAIRRVANEPFDLIHLESIHMAGYLSHLFRNHRIPVFWDWHNIESEIMFRYGQNTPSAARAYYARFTGHRLVKLEDSLLRKPFGHVVCSAREQDSLLQRVPRAKVAVIENGVDTAYFSERTAAPRLRTRLVFIGAMSYHANSDAALFFAHEIWPAIHARFPEWTFTIAGSNPPDALRAIHAKNGIEVTGTVADVRPYYREAVAALVPLRVGAGTRLKILEAMAAGVPVISTSLGAEGLAVSPGKDLLIANAPDEWLPKLQAISVDANLWNSLSSAGRALVESRYDWDFVGKRLYDTYAEWLGGIQPHSISSC